MVGVRVESRGTALTKACMVALEVWSLKMFGGGRIVIKLNLTGWKILEK